MTVTIHNIFCAILMISVVKLIIRPEIRINFLLSQVLDNDIMQTCIEFNGNPSNIKKVAKPDIRPDIGIITKNERDLFWHSDTTPW